MVLKRVTCDKREWGELFIYRSLIFFEIFFTLIIHGLKRNFPSPLQFSWIFLHISTTLESRSCIQSQSLAVHLFTPYLLWTPCVANTFRSWTDYFTLLPLHIQTQLSVEPVGASVQHNCRACMTKENIHFHKFQGLIYNCPAIFCICSPDEITKIEINCCVLTVSHTWLWCPMLASTGGAYENWPLTWIVLPLRKIFSIHPPFLCFWVLKCVPFIT